MPRAHEVLVCPPFVYLWEIGRQLKGTPDRARRAGRLRGGGAGAFTGEVSGAMLRDVGCTYAIVGHSERRALYREDDALVARKFVATQAQGLVPILCVGETLEERETNATREVVARQLDAVVSVAGIAAFARSGRGVRAGVGDRHGQERDARTRPRKYTRSCANVLRRGMLQSRRRCAFCTAAASRRRTPPSCSPCRT
jgi:hypothetical protein